MRACARGRGLLSYSEHPARTLVAFENLNRPEDRGHTFINFEALKYGRGAARPVVTAGFAHTTRISITKPNPPPRLCNAHDNTDFLFSRPLCHVDGVGGGGPVWGPKNSKHHLFTASATLSHKKSQLTSPGCDAGSPSSWRCCHYHPSAPMWRHPCRTSAGVLATRIS